jgi:hypothetical protein
MTTAELSPSALRLTIPTNPNVDISVVPTAEFEYANPVTLNNMLLLYGNAVIELAGKRDRAGKRLEAAKLERRKAERQLEDFEQGLLRTHPAPRGVTTLKLLAAHIEAAAFSDDTSDQYDDLRNAVRTAEDAVEAANAQISTLKGWGDAIETASGNITVHLSYVKAEWNHSGRR